MEADSSSEQVEEANQKPETRNQKPETRNPKPFNPSGFDTIAAISTPPGRGGIGVIRLSGPAAYDIAASIFRAGSGDPAPAAGRAHVGHIVDPSSGETIDEAVLLYFKAPRSYTGEDVVELSCHGSPLLLRRVLELTMAGGARLAEPGEFTLRAFLNKRIDLAQAQAVRDVIDAQTEHQARVAARQLEGSLSKRLQSFKETLIEIIVHLESSIEFVEDDITPDAASGLMLKLQAVIDGLNRAAASFSFGRYLKEGFDLAIVGRPNVGKSSVFNRLIGSDRAIVTEVPGTTRDALYESTSISGVPVRLIDTAGIRETEDRIESIGITRSRAAIADADVSLLVLDASEPLTSDDLRLLAQVPKENRIIGVNKSDLPRRLNDGADELDCSGSVSISALTGAGIDDLREMILAHLCGEDAAERDDTMITDARQHAAVRQAVDHLSQGRDLLVAGEHEEIVLLKLRAGLAAIGEITGETLTEDILGQIFSTFCIGK